MSKVTIVDPHDIMEIKFLNSFSDHEDTHPIVKIKGIDGWLRGRSEMLIVGNDGVTDKIRITRKKKGLCSEFPETDLDYDVPGGGWKPDEFPDYTARREAKEEARILTQSSKSCGGYVVIRDQPHPWVQEHIPAEYAWNGYFTWVFVGEYQEVYHGDIDPRDSDPDMVDGEWIAIDDIFDQLCPAHQSAIKEYYAWVKKMNQKED